MRRLKLAYRDDDRTPVIFCIKEIAARYYDIDVEVLQIRDSEEYEAALFNGAADIIIEHLEYLYEAAAKGERITMFCAPSKGGNLELVVPACVKSAEDFKGETIAVRSAGQPHAVILWLKMMGLEKEVKTVLVRDSEVGRWGQWKKVASGECVATFISPLYLPQALSAGLRVLPVPDIPIVGHHAQACMAEFASGEPSLLKDYLKSVIHAICLMLFRREEALAVVAIEPMRRMKVESKKELERLFDAIIKGLKPKPYPAPQAIANSYEIATLEYPRARGLNPLSLWDLHWVRELDDEGFIESLVQQMDQRR
jgi:NMT1/THI5 like